MVLLVSNLSGKLCEFGSGGSHCQFECNGEPVERIAGLPRPVHYVYGGGSQLRESSSEDCFNCIQVLERNYRRTQPNLFKPCRKDVGVLIGHAQTTPSLQASQYPDEGFKLHPCSDADVHTPRKRESPKATHTVPPRSLQHLGSVGPTKSSIVLKAF